MKWSIALFLLVLSWNCIFGWKWRTTEDALIQEVRSENEVVKFKRSSTTTGATSKAGTTTSSPAEEEEDEDMLVFEGRYFKPNEVPPPPKFMTANNNWRSESPAPQQTTKAKQQKSKTSSSFYYVTTVGTGSRLPPLSHKFTEENAKKQGQETHAISASPPNVEDLQSEDEEQILSEDAPKCFTTTDTEGQCLPFKQCYPVVFNVIDGDLRNPGLAKLLYQSSGPCNATLEIDFALGDKLTSDKTFFNAEFYNQSICCPRFKHPPTLLTSREDDVRSTRLILNEQKSSSTPVSIIMRNTFKGFTASTTAIPTTTTTENQQDDSFIITSGFPESSSHPLGVDDSSVESPQNQETTEREEDILDDDDADSMEDGNIQLAVDTEIEKENVTDAVIKVENTAEIEPEGKKSVDAFASVPAPNLSPNKCRHQIYGMPRGHWPWMVALVISSRHICSGALIDEKYVITAAHCVYLLDAADMKKLRIIIGDRVMYSTVDGPHFWRKVTKIITHKNYNQQTFASDIAILKMNSNVPYSRNVQPVSLSDLVSPVDSNNFGKGIVAGWSGADIGQPAFEARTETETVVDIMDKATCREVYRGFALSGVATNTFCTRAANNTCVADSGAPLIVRVQNCWVLGGIMSWGLGCSHFPEVYTDVTRYTSWIRKHAI